MAAKTTQALKLTCVGSVSYTVTIHWDEDYNQFWLYRHWTIYDGANPPKNRKQLAAKYANMTSCLCHIADDLRNRGL